MTSKARFPVDGSVAPTNTVGQSWNDWWFQPADSRPLAAIRIATGLLLLIYVASWGNAANWLSSDGILPLNATFKVLDSVDPNAAVVRGYALFGDSPAVVVTVQLVLGLSAILLALGCFTRIVVAIAWLSFLWFAHRACLVTGTVEPILAMLLFYLLWSPCQAHWSVDAWRKNKQPAAKAAQPKQTSLWGQWLPAPIVANLAIKMLQIHFALLVLSMAEAKLTAPVWWEGEAIWYLTASTHSRPLDLTFLRSAPLLINGWTHFIVLAEVLFPALVWFPRIRPVVLSVAAVAWLTLPLVTGDWMFPLALGAALLAFVPAAWLPTTLGLSRGSKSK